MGRVHVVLDGSNCGVPIHSVGVIGCPRVNSAKDVFG